jgi:hypothetical protein
MFEFSKHLVHQDKTSSKILDIGKHTRTSWKGRGQPEVCKVLSIVCGIKLLVYAVLNLLVYVGL